MKTGPSRNVFYLLLLFFLVSACKWTDQISGSGPTFTPAPAAQVTPTLAVTATAATSSTPAAGSLADFSVFAADIAAAIRARDASFFEQRSAPQVWNCLGDETEGICQGHASSDVLQGIPVTHDWATPQLYKGSDYRKLWQTAFAQNATLQLVAVANRSGDNPLMPMAEQSFLAVIAVAGNGAQAPVREVRVLFFEYSEQAWRLEGELVTADHAQDWLTDTCSMCYDAWLAWPK